VSVPATVRAFLAGNSGSGKSVRAWNLYLRAFPRRLLLDLTGEWESQADAVADDVAGTVAAIRDLAPRGRWTVAAGLDAGQLPALVDWLMPVPNLRASPVLALHGVVILVDEVDLLAPPGMPTEAVRTLYRRSRHVGLSVVSTTQRPANVNREVSAQSTHAVALHLSEPRDVDYMADLMRWERPQVEAWRAWTRRHPHGGVWQDLRANRRLFLPEAGPPVMGPNDAGEGADARPAGPVAPYPTVAPGGRAPGGARRAG